MWNCSRFPEVPSSKLPDTDRFSGTVRAFSSPEPVMLHKRAKQTRSVGGVSHVVFTQRR